MTRLTRRRALATVLCHVWFVAHGFVCSPAIYMHRERIRAPTSCIRAQQQHQSTVLQEASTEIQQLNMTETLWTYARNIPQASRRHASAREQLRPVYSLLHFLLKEQRAHITVDMDIQEPLERATIQAIRAASAAGEYRLIIRLVQAAIHVCQNQPMLTSRLFGEAIESLSRTRCNVSKLKNMWNLAQEHAFLMCESGLTAFELNTMLKALASRGKIRAALNLYESEKQRIPGDAYTMCILLTALLNSISQHQSPAVAADYTCSPCWQYTTGRQLLDQARPHELNNYVFAAALRLNERAGQVFSTSTQRHYVAKCAMDLLQLMKKLDISPDVVTCSLVASAFDKAHQSKAAVALLNVMVKGGTTTWSLAPPNEYVYSSVISACARCNEYEAALNVLERMRSDDNCQLNTWVYNAALQACAGETIRNGKQRTKQGQMALTLLKEMEQCSKKGMNTAPDTVTYNTVLAAIGGGIGPLVNEEQFSALVSLDSMDEWSPQEVTVFKLLERMKEKGIPRDSLTYHNAINAVCSNSKAVLMILDAAIQDLEKGSDSSAKLEGRAAEGLPFVFNSALSVLSYGLGMVPIASVLSRMAENQVHPNSESLIHLLNALGSSGYSDYIPIFLESLEGDTDSIDKIRQEFDIHVQDQFMTTDKLTPELNHYSAAIKSCLSTNDIDNALKVLSLMRDKNLSPDTDVLEEIALTYCRLATIASAEESKIGRRVRSRKKKKTRTVQMDVKRSVSAARARSALDISLSLENPSIHLFSTLAKACCSAGMWAEGRMILGRVHNAAVSMGDTLSHGSFHPQRRNDPMLILPGLHRSLLKLCASKGNATAALGFVDDIQALTQSLAVPDDDSIISDEVLLSSFFEKIENDEEGVDISEVSNAVASMASNIDNNASGIGMKGEDWKLLLIAASKAGHWRLCLGTLQFLKPFLEATNPDYDERASLKWKSKIYDKLGRSLTAAILCFEIRGQYAWAIRAIEDWIEWSGRRPRKEAVLGAFRILSRRGQGFQLNRLLQRILDVQATPFDESESTYAVALCTGAINSLHQHGLYEDADELYLQACSRGYLPFSIDRGDLPNEFTIDLHGMNVAMAHSAVRIALQQYALPESQDSDLVVVTGRGMNSAQRLRPVLRPEVQRMLLEEFYPPLSTTSVPGNMGALRVPSHDVNEWVAQQRQQKGVRMLAVADILKNLTSGERIRNSIEKSLQTDEGDNNEEME